MAFSQHSSSTGIGGSLSGGLTGSALMHDGAGEADSVSSYFECITACSIDDGECVTRCVEVLREQH